MALTDIFLLILNLLLILIGGLLWVFHRRTLAAWQAQTQTSLAATQASLREAVALVQASLGALQATVREGQTQQEREQAESHRQMAQLHQELQRLRQVVAEAGALTDQRLAQLDTTLRETVDLTP